MTIERNQLSGDLEKEIESYALQFLSQGRKEWDEPHTRAVVYYAGLIAESEGSDTLVLKTAAWLHDIGYYGLFEGADSKAYDQVMDKKAMHMVNGARLVKEFLDREDIRKHYSPDQMERMVHLVSVHDKIEELKDKDEIVLMEADTLGAIDISRVVTTFDKAGALKYVEKDLMGRRYPRFETRLGKELFNQLIQPFVGQFR